MNTRWNLVGVDPTRHTPSYESRLYKYGLRGWAIAQPGIKGCQIQLNIETVAAGNEALQGVRGIAKVLLMEQRDNFKANKGKVYVAMGFDKRKSKMLGSSSKDLKQLLCDDGTDGDYAPDILNPYTASMLVADQKDTWFGNKMFDLQEKTVRELVTERARSGLPLDQAACDDMPFLEVPLLFKLFEHVSRLPSRRSDLAHRLTKARDALRDVFCSPELREYRRKLHRLTIADPAAAALLKKSTVNITYTKEEGGAELIFACDIQHQYTFPPEFPRRIAFMTENPGRQGFFTGSFHSEAGTPTDAWLDARFFTFAGGMGSGGAQQGGNCAGL